MQAINSQHPVYLWIMLLLLTIYAGFKVIDIVNLWSLNKQIANPESISEPYSELPEPLIFAKAWQLNLEDDYQQALRLYNQLEQSKDQQLLESARYNMATTYLQQAAKLWNAKGVYEYEQINTLLDLAEQTFRQVLLNQPQHWQARYNLEFALRIRPPNQEQEEADWQGHKTSVHAIMPGIPAGGP